MHLLMLHVSIVGVVLIVDIIIVVEAMLIFGSSSFWVVGKKEVSHQLTK